MNFKKTSSGVVINTNKDGYLRAKKMKSIITGNNNKILELEEKLKDQEKVISEILKLLKK